MVASVLFWAILVIVSPAAVATNGTSFLLCTFAGGWTSPYAATVYQTVQAANVANTFPGVHFNFKFLRATAPFESKARTQNIVKSWVVNGSDCDAVIGPGTSGSAVGLSPVVEVPWVDGSASSTELSNKGRHPFFSRTIPTDARGTFVTMRAMVALGWKDFNVIIIDYEYGRSLGEGFLAAAKAFNATVHVTAKLPSSSARTFDDILAVTHRIVRDSPSRIVFIGGSLPAEDFKKLHEHKVDEELVFVFGEVACRSSSLTPSYTHLSGALCTSYSFDSTLPFASAFKNRSVEVEQSLFRDAGIAFPNDMRKFSLYSALNQDAANLTMMALARFATLNPHASTHNNQAAVAQLRSIHFHGATGVVSLDALGDRLSASAVLYSSSIGNQTGHTVVGVVNSTIATLHTAELFLLGSTKTVGRETESVARRPVAADADSPQSTLLVALAVVIVFVVLVLVAVVAGFSALVCCRRSSRNNDAAPKDSKQPFAIVFTDIQSSTTLWSMIPEKMSTALDLHHDTIRLLIAEHNGYEVKTIGDAFMVAFSDPRDSFKFALATQIRFAELPWDEAIEETYSELLEERHAASVSSRGTWPGLRVRVGIHYGCGSIVEDSTTGGFDYYGTVVNTAARVESVGHGGQILVTQAAFDAVGEHLGRTVVHKALGTCELRGLADPISLIQLLPMAMSSRLFPPLRLEKADFVQDAPEGLDLHKSSRSRISSDVSPDGGTSSTGGAIDYDDLGARYAKVMMSTLPVSERANVVMMLGKRWHVPMGKQSQLRSDPAKLERAVASIGQKCTWVVALQRVPSHLALATSKDEVRDSRPSDGRMFATPDGEASISVALNVPSPPTGRSPTVTLHLPNGVASPILSPVSIKDGRADAYCVEQESLRALSPELESQLPSFRPTCS